MIADPPGLNVADAVVLPAVLYGLTLMLSSEPSAIHGEKGARFRAAANKPIAPIVKK